FDGTTLVASKVGSRHVQGRTAAGGQSQQRFARRRAKQAREAFEAAADVAARILVPHVPDLDAVVTGGDRAAIDSVLTDRRLAAIRDLVTGPLLNVGDPKLTVLKSTPAQFRAVRIRLAEPEGPGRGRTDRAKSCTLARGLPTTRPGRHKFAPAMVALTNVVERKIKHGHVLSPGSAL